MLGILFAAVNSSEKVFVIDEIDRGLHPLLSHRFVELFFELSKGKTQLIVTSHETQLMDLDLLRQNEIWLVSKSSSGASRLYSLDEFNVRFDKRLSRAYLSGIYGGIPLIESFSQDAALEANK